MQNYRSVSYIKQSLTREVTPAVSISGRAIVSDGAVGNSTIWNDDGLIIRGHKNRTENLNAFNYSGVTSGLNKITYLVSVSYTH